MGCFPAILVPWLSITISSSHPALWSQVAIVFKILRLKLQELWPYFKSVTNPHCLTELTEVLMKCLTLTHLRNMLRCCNHRDYIYIGIMYT